MKKHISSPVHEQKDDDITSCFTGYGVVPQKVQKQIMDQKKKQSYIEQAKKVKNVKKKEQTSVKAMYGKKGLLNFLANIFVYMTEKDKQQINFYFTIRDLIIDYCEKSGSQLTDVRASENDLFGHI